MTHAERRGRAGVALGGAPQSRVFGGDRGFLNLVIPWLLLCLLLIGTSAHRIAGLQMSDPDDYMRLLQVQDWLAGQSWWDVANYRMGSPPGADMHWSRLVDLPIAAAILLAELFVSHASAVRFAATVIPLLQLLTAMVLTFAHTLGEFGIVLMVGGSIPGQTKTIAIAIYDRVQAFDTDAAGVMAATLVAISFVTIATTYWLSARLGRRLT